MNYKQMILLEDLVNNHVIHKEVQLCFLYNQYNCTAEFRNEEKAHEEVVIASEQLFDDYLTYTTLHSSAYIENLNIDLQEDDAEIREKMLKFLFNSMVVFLEDQDTDLEKYLIYYDENETIYNLNILDESQKSYEVFSMKDVEVEPYALVK